MGPEAKLWKTLKPLLEAEKCMTTRIENRNGGGLPDVDVSSPVGAFKIELKVVEKISVRLSDMQIAYNTLLTHKHGLSFILAEVPARPMPSQIVNLFEDQGPGSEEVGSGSVGSGTKDQGPGPSGRGRGNRVGSGRGQSGRGPRASVGSGRDRYYLWHGRDAVDVGRVGLRAEALASGSSLSDLVQVMLAVCRAHHVALLEKGPGR
jgi:hypothetical protein